MEQGPKTPQEAIQALNEAYDKHGEKMEIRLTTDKNGTVVKVGSEVIYSSQTAGQESET